MNKTKIPWTTYSINPIKGLCPMDCKDLEGKPYCYARKMYKRFKWNPEIRFEQSVLRYEYKDTFPDGSRVFVGSTIELFGDWVKPEWIDNILIYCKYHPFVTFIFLTKQPQNLIKWSPFPPNCWVGVSATDTKMFIPAINWLDEIEAKVKYISFEPLLGRIPLNYEALQLAGISWVIIGSKTQPVRHPPREWVDEIISAADKAMIPVFVKEPMASHYGINRKEFPKLGK